MYGGQTESVNRKEIERIVRRVLEETAGSRSAPAGGTRERAGEMAGDMAGEAAERLTAVKGGFVHTTMPLAEALELIGKVEARAAQRNMRVVTAVSDAWGNPVAVHCMDGAYPGSFDVALNKTYTAAAFQMSTARLGQLSQPGESLYGIQFTNHGRIVIFGGGELLKRGNVILGALGVSGGTAQEDTELAAYGKAVFEEGGE
ncbi:MAG: heme-binding protein [Acetatifactor sp.]|nr:heme-binding protein [Acetatifactor sp.]